MSAASENQDLMALKKLLTSWHVDVLFDLFKEEDISINELKMMECNHMHGLLKHYKTGIKIRFEYNLKNWRQKLGLPLKTCLLNHHCTCCCSTNKGHFENNTAENHHHAENTTSKSNSYSNSKRNVLDVDAAANKKQCMDENQPTLSPQSIYSNNSLINMLNSDDVFNFGPISELNNEKAQSTDNDIDLANAPVQALGELLSDTDNVPPKFPSKSTPEKYTVNLQLILKMSGERGAAIIKFYKEKNRLIDLYRFQLIQIIVDYFIENDYHLSLNLSHNLEWEIIKMFPTEKLHYYRTEKRGKIYAKFSNMKRYKRDRSIKSLTEVQQRFSRRSRQKYDKDADNDSVQNNDDDNWCPTAEPEIVVKEEHLNDDNNK